MQMVCGFDIINIFNRHYAASGSVWYNAVSQSAGYTQDHRLSAISYIPMAGTTVMGHVTLKF